MDLKSTNGNSIRQTDFPGFHPPFAHHKRFVRNGTLTYSLAMASADSANPLATEIKQETAQAYFAACKKMVESLEALEAFDRTAPAALRDHAQIKRRSELIEDAAERVFYVVIQREAMKLSGYEEFFRNYGIPAEVRACLGPKRIK